MDSGHRRVTIKFNHKKVVEPFRTQSCTRIKRHTGRSIDITANAGNDMGCLTFKPGLIHSLIHPHFVIIITRIAVFTKLPVDAPPGIRTIHDINQTLTLSGMIPIIVNRDDITILIKDKFMGIAKAMGEYFKIRTIRIAAHNDTFIRIRPFLTRFINSVKSDITDSPVNTSIRPHDQAAKVMPAKTDMYLKTMADRFFFIHDAISVFIGQTPQVRGNSQK